MTCSCGIGGFHTALSNLGHKCVFASDSDKFCREVYEMNYGIKPNDDVKKIDPEKLEDFDILCAGFLVNLFQMLVKRNNLKIIEDFCLMKLLKL